MANEFGLGRTYDALTAADAAADDVVGIWDKSAARFKLITVAQLQALAQGGDIVSDAMAPVVSAATLEAAADAWEYRPTGLTSADGDARSLADRAADALYADDFVLDSDAGDYALAIQRAVDYLSGLSTPSGGVVHLGRGLRLCATGIVIDHEGITLRGEGTALAWASGPGDSPTDLRFDHTDGACIRAKSPGVTLEGFRVSSGATRAMAAAGTNYGIEYQADDAPEPPTERVNFPRLRNIHVEDQPSHGVVIIGQMVGALLDHVSCIANGGHGILIDCGDAVGRTNTARPGLATLINTRTSDNLGHGLCIGDPNNNGLNGGNIPYRVHALNHESFRNALSAGVRHTDADTYVHGENIELVQCAFGGFDANGDNAVDGLYLAGRNIAARNCRYLSNITPIVIDVIDETNGVTIDGVLVGPGPAGTRPVLVEFPTATVKNVRVIAPVQDSTAPSTHWTTLTSTSSNVDGFWFQADDAIEHEGNVIWRGVHQFGANPEIFGATPRLFLNETDATANERVWSIDASGDALRMRAFDDAKSGNTIFFAVTRTGTTVDSVTFTATNFVVTGNLNVTGTISVAGTQVVGPQGAAVPDASGGTTIDAEARTAINTLLARLRAHGLIAA